MAQGGLRDVEAGLPVETDTLWRIYSMTKPITSVAAMLLWEEGAFELKDPVARFIPCFADARVWRGGSQDKPVTVPATEPIRMWHLLTHTAGLTYGFHYAHPVDGDLPRPRVRVRRAAGHGPGRVLRRVGGPAAAVRARHASSTTRVATDVLGRVVEVLSGQTLDVFFEERIFGPLGMTDTALRRRRTRRGSPRSTRPAWSATTRMGAPRCARRRSSPAAAGWSPPPPTTTASRACCSAGRRGRCSGPRTLRFMARNHLPGRRRAEGLRAAGRRDRRDRRTTGMGFGLGFSVVEDPVGGQDRLPRRASSPGAARPARRSGSTAPERITAQFFTQLLPSSTYPLRSQLRQLVYQALVD